MTWGILMQILMVCGAALSVAITTAVIYVIIRILQE